MTSLKPPVGLSGTLGVPDAAAVDAVAELGSAARTAASDPVAATGAADALTEIARAVAEGTLSVEAAVERLVERAVGPLATSLSAVEREELVTLLRDVLAHDPTLGALRDSLR